MENRVGTAGGSVEFEFKVESTEAGKWYQGNHRVVNLVFFISAKIFFRFRIFITPLEPQTQDTTDSKEYIHFLQQK